GSLPFSSITVSILEYRRPFSAPAPPRPPILTPSCLHNRLPSLLHATVSLKPKSTRPSTPTLDEGHIPTKKVISSFSAPKTSLQPLTPRAPPPLSRRDTLALSRSSNKSPQSRSKLSSLQRCASMTSFTSTDLSHTSHPLSTLAAAPWPLQDQTSLKDKKSMKS